MKTILPLIIISLIFFFSSCFNESVTGPQVGNGPAPAEFYLKQNYPNPFVDTTAIDYGVPSSGGSNSTVSIIVYNRFQESVRTLVYSSSHNPGNFRTKWDGKNSRGIIVPSGVYVIEMKGFTPQTVILQITAIKI